MLEFNAYKWKCPICGLWHRVKKIWGAAEYIKRCKCGGYARLYIVREQRKVYESRIIKGSEV
jgi:hypothetical protein